MNSHAADSDRLTIWVREHGAALFGFLLRSVGDRALAEDLAQETFARAWQHRARYHEAGQQRAYLMRIAAHLVRDHYRRPQVVRLFDSDAAEPPAMDDSPPAQFEQAELEAELREALDGLTPAQRQTLLLRYYGKMTFEQIAEALGAPLGTVLSHARRGLASLRKLLVSEV
jgi:RNA polymerase sigma-70 factor (ECF subfamily)